MSNYRVGLTGGIGSGKTTVANIFAEKGITIVDTDVIAHQLTGQDGGAMPRLIAAFGHEIVDHTGALDRVAMRQRVFADPQSRQRLETILHPMIAAHTMDACSQATSPYVIVAVPLLLEASGWRERFDRILVVDCDEATQIHRVMARNALPEKDVRAILAAQANRQERLAAADDLLENSATPSALTRRIDQLHQLYLKLSNKKTSSEVLRFTRK